MARKRTPEPSGIYRWRNLINNKVYVGLSIKLRTRYQAFTHWQTHYAGTKDLDKDRSEYSDIKYWEYTILEYCNKELLKEREIYWIAQHNSTNKEIGYNISPGGEMIADETIRKIRDKQKGRPLTEEHRKALGRPVHQYTKEGKFIKEWSSASEAEITLNIKHISKACKGVIQSAGGFMWKLASDTSPVKKYTPRTNSKPILQCSLEGDVIREWKSIRKAAQTLGISDTAISSVCKGRIPSYKGYVWKYKCSKDCTSSRKMIINPVVQMDNDNTIITLYPSARQGHIATKASTTNIIRACKGIYQTAGGFRWRFATREECVSLSEYKPFNWTEKRKLEMSQKFSGENNPSYGKHHTEETKRKISLSKTVSKAKPETIAKRQRVVVQMDNNDLVIKIWPSIKEAEKTLNVDHISAVCRGRQRNKTGGFKWRYATPEEIATLNTL